MFDRFRLIFLGGSEDQARSGDMWEVAPGWPVPHLVCAYAAAILDFVELFVIFTNKWKKTCFWGFDRCSIDVR